MAINKKQQRFLALLAGQSETDCINTDLISSYKRESNSLLLNRIYGGMP